MLITHWFWANNLSKQAINRIRCPIVFYFVWGWKLGCRTEEATHFTLSKGEIFIPARFTLKNAGAASTTTNNILFAHYYYCNCRKQDPNLQRIQWQIRNVSIFPVAPHLEPKLNHHDFFHNGKNDILKHIKFSLCGWPVYYKLRF